MQKPHLTIIIGPTASGKTNAAIAYAKKHNGAIISADSRQLYTGMNIGTAKPEELWDGSTHDIATPDTIQNIPHYLFNIRELTDPMTLSDWQQAAYDIIDSVIDSGKHPILVGGTMLYIDSIIRGYNIPNVAPNEALRTSLEKKSPEELQKLLEEQDPQSLTFIEPHNTRRMIRALEVLEATGKKFSDIRTTQDPHYTCSVIGLFPGWEVLEERITKRVTTMLASGIIEETKKLQQLYGADAALLQTINYKEATGIIAGEYTEIEARKKMIQANMRYARRQMSWWRGRSDIQWVAK